MENDKRKNIERQLDTPADFTSPEVLFEELIKKIKAYHPSDDFSLVERAYQIASDAHKDQKRKSGEPYIIHPLCVAITLAELELDKETIVAGILHDVLEDTECTAEDMEKEYKNYKDEEVSKYISKMIDEKYNTDLTKTKYVKLTTG